YDFYSLLLCFFFFSSRRRHTRFSRDWSSDVCSSDLSLRNGCAAPASLEAPRARLGLSDFTFGEELPLTLEPGESAPLRIEFEPTAPGAREDVLFVDVDVAGETHRYAVTVVSDG